MAGGYADWHGHVIVCGLRGVGLRIVEELNLSGVPAVVIDDDPDVRLARILTSWGVPHIAASSRIAETLTGAGLAGATAVICVQHDDLYTLETALLTRQLREDVRVVVQLGNPAVGRALSQVGVSVLDVAGLSAPSVVEACLQSGAQEIRLSGERFTAARTAAPRAASLRELYGALAPIAVVPGDGGQVRALGVPVVIADATMPVVLESVRLTSASAVAVVTSDDLANLETGLAVRDQRGARWETTPVVLRIFDPQLARSVKNSFGFTLVRSTAALAAPWFVGAALGLDVLSTFYAGDEPLLVARLTITPQGGLHGLAMNDLVSKSRVLAIRRAADKAILEHPPRRRTRFRPDDEAYLIGPYTELLTVLRRDRPSPQAPGAPPPGRPLALASESRPDHQSVRQPEDPDGPGLEALPCWCPQGRPDR